MNRSFGFSGLVETYIKMYIAFVYMYIYIERERCISYTIYIYRRGGCGACVFATHYFQWSCMFRVVARGFL